MRSTLRLLIALLVIAGLVASCTPRTVEVEKEVIKEVPKEVVKEVEKLVTPTPVPSTRTGAWLDTIVVVEEPSADAAVSRLETGDIDGYWYSVSNPAVFKKVKASPNLKYYQAFGSYNELTFNPAGPVFEGSGKLNPFAVPAMREAMNWLIDRQYIASEIMGGLASARWTPFNNASGDYAKLADVARKLELKYAYDQNKAKAVFDAEMPKIGATLTNGKWTYKGEPVEIILLIRNEDERKAIGDYAAKVLEDIGFTCVRDYKKAADASPIWMSGNPPDGKFHIYTGGWVTTAVPRDLGGNLPYFYTDMGLASPLWQAYKNTPEFYDLCQKLDNNDFTSLDERAELLSKALELSFEDSNRIWLVDRASFSPVLKDNIVAADLYGGISGAWLWPVTIQREGQEGGSMTIAQPSILTEPWNPLNGTNWIYDMTWIRGTGEMAYVPDPYTGLYLPRRVERAEVTVQEGLPVGKTLDWVDLKFAAKIEVPGDAWADWDAKEQRFLTASEVYTETQTALRKSVVYYPADLYDKVTWHDGSKFSIGDVVMAMIVQFDRAKKDSPVYDKSQEATFKSFMSAFKGVKIVSQKPLVIETYSDLYYLDAEWCNNFWWPYYLQGEGSWHALALGLLAEEKQEAAFTAAKAKDLEVEWLSYIAGPTIEVLKKQLAAVVESGEIPYKATLGKFVSADEIKARFDNLNTWFGRRGHFWIGTGPFYLERAFPVEGTLVLRRYVAYPDSASRWAGYSGPMIAQVDVSGPSRVTIGQEAVFEAEITFDGQPYLTADLEQVKFLVLDAKGEVAHVDAAKAVADGKWTATLSKEVTAKLAAGSNKLEVIVVSRKVAVPGFGSIQFVTAP
ncbi:MAG TPA: ABC transporter substrate-binding protein [Anaerolineae bacterium]|nr:ABC transporter substrate-binding protein [Anaerolineae bacterium]HPL29483.1 ABC transporter substrate-binding protein [Anaerolineae bacterium]